MSWLGYGIGSSVAELPINPPSTLRPRQRGFWLIGHLTGWSVRWLLPLALLLGGYMLYLDRQVVALFDGQRWALPARVYARPLELYPGMVLRPEQLIAELKRLHYRATPDPKIAGAYQRRGDQFTLHARAFSFWDGAQAAQRLQLRFSAGTLAELRLEDNAAPLALARLDPPLIASIYPTDHQDRVLVPLDEVPQFVTAALMAVEDRGFYDHFGIDPRGVARALLTNVRAGGMVQGGSTLTQQLVKNFYLSAERTLWRKFNEALMALILELRYSKAQILEAYLNEIYLGQQGERAIHGFALASHFYFDRPLDQLDLPKIALLVGLARAPSAYNPRRFPERALERRAVVLQVLHEVGLIDAKALRQAKATPLGITAKPPGGATLYPAFLELVRRQLQRDYREADLRSEGLRIFTTLDPLAQQAAETALATKLRGLERGRFRPDTLEGALVLSRTQDGEVIAVVGGRDAQFSGFNRAINALRPIGSLIKPAVYLTALTQRRHTLVSLIDDGPLELKPTQGPVWRPQNYDHQHHGQVPLHIALAQSYNIANVRIGLEVGVDAVLQTLTQLGVNRKIQPYPSILLGALELTPLEVAQMYQTLAGGGFYTPLRTIREILDAQGKPLQRYPLTVQQTVNPAAVFALNFALREVVERGTARALNGLIPVAVAGKTGTTDELRDSWFAGFSEDVLAVAWVGRDDNKPTGLSGAKGALPVWAETMRHLPLQALQLVPPEGIEWAQIQGCGSSGRFPFLAGTSANARAQCTPPADEPQQDESPPSVNDDELF